MLTFGGEKVSINDKGLACEKTKEVQILKSEGGFTYLAAIVLVMIMGIMLGIMGETWQMMMKREKEEELLFRGDQIRYGIERWNTPKPGQNISTPLQDLKDLLKDPRSLANMRYLRRLYTDPITGKDWTLIKDPVRGVIGVASPSEAEPVKKANFPIVNEKLPDGVNYRPDIYKSFEGKKKYSDWQFVYGQVAPATSVSGIKTTSIP